MYAVITMFTKHSPAFTSSHWCTFSQPPPPSCCSACNAKITQGVSSAQTPLTGRSRRGCSLYHTPLQSLRRTPCMTDRSLFRYDCKCPCVAPQFRHIIILSPFLSILSLPLDILTCATYFWTRLVLWLFFRPIKNQHLFMSVRSGPTYFTILKTIGTSSRSKSQRKK